MTGPSGGRSTDEGRIGRERINVPIGAAVGLAIGVAIGLATHSMGVAAPAGVAIGAGIGGISAILIRRNRLARRTPPNAG